MENEIKDLQDKLDALKLRYEQSKQPFKNGDVVKNKYGVMYLITDYEKECGYGFDVSGNWTVSKSLDFKNHVNHLKLATSEEWLEALTKEAVKRGLVHGAKLNNNNVLKRTNIIDFIIPHDRIYKLESNNLFTFDNNNNTYYTLMQDGIWAEVIKEETLEELAKRFMRYWISNNGILCNDFTTFFNENKETINRLSK